MKNELKNFWYDTKYDIIYIILCSIMYFILSKCYYAKLTDWQYWFMVLIIVPIRFIGYKEGQRTIIKSIVENSANVSLDIIDDRFENVTCELKDIATGTFFSLASDEHRTKYLKCNKVNEGSTKCWNFDTEEIVLMNDDAECVLYKTKIIYTPVLKNYEE